MKTIILALLVLATNIQAQYSIQQAFPNVSGFNIALEMTPANDGTNRLFIIQRRGIINVIDADNNLTPKKTFIDMSPLFSVPSDEVLGIVFHPNYEVNGNFYVAYCIDSLGFRIKIIRLTVSSNPDSASLSTRAEVLSYLEPDDHHQGGKMLFGQDGYLYYSFGDETLIAGDNHYLNGKLIRIDVSTIPYTIPPTNPYINHPTFRKEIYASGFRNPHKFSFDYVTNKIWLGDVGDGSWEEVNDVEKGKNYGWPYMEGFSCYGFGCDTAGRNLTPPFYAYPHNGTGKSITGGFVYRGHSDSGLYGKYIYADFVQKQIFALDLNTRISQQLVQTTLLMATFGETEHKELYVADLFSGIYSFYTIYKQGDVNKDGAVNLADMILVYNANINFESGINLRTDLNFDGFVSLKDIIILYNLL